MLWLLKGVVVLLLFNAIDAPRQDTLLLSFDVELPDNSSDVNGLLDILQEHGAQATFFVEGEFAQREPELVRRMLAEGHEVGCHTLHHPYLILLDEEGQRAEIGPCKELLEGLGADVQGFRAPYHLLGWGTVRILKEEGFSYDASGFRVSRRSRFLPRVRVSTFFGLPLEDYTLLYALRLEPDAYFWLLAHHPGRYHSLNFHPHHIMRERESFEKVLEGYDGCRMVSHASFLAGRDDEHAVDE